MKYRIKIVTHKNGRKLYYPAFKSFIWWTGLSIDGETGSFGECVSRHEALRRIDKHAEGNSTKSSIEFEYFTK